MDHVLSARALMGISLGFHIIYATIGVGLPLLLMLAEGVSFRTGDELYHLLARSWVRPAGLLFAIGAVSGTILSFELGLLWPRFMAFSGPLIGLPFSMEGFAFFIEAIFLALYSYGEKRLSRRMQLLYAAGLTPSARYEKKKCDNCSLLELCRPKQLSRPNRASIYLRAAIAANLEDVPG